MKYEVMFVNGKISTLEAGGKEKLKSKACFASMFSIKGNKLSEKGSWMQKHMLLIQAQELRHLKQYDISLKTCSQNCGGMGECRQKRGSL